MERVPPAPRSPRTRRSCQTRGTSGHADEKPPVKTASWDGFYVSGPSEQKGQKSAHCRRTLQARTEQSGT